MVCKGVPPKSQGFRHCNFLSDCHSLTMTTSFCRSPYIILPGFCFKALAEHYELKCDSLKEIDVRIKDFYHTKKLPDQLLLKFDPFTISTKSLAVHKSTKGGMKCRTNTNVQSDILHSGVKFSCVCTMTYNGRFYASCWQNPSRHLAEWHMEQGQKGFVSHKLKYTVRKHWCSAT